MASKKSGPGRLSKISQWRPSYVGTVVAVVFVYMSWLPSLLARPAWLQAVATGISAAIGYGIGLGLSALIRWLMQYELSREAKQTAWRSLAIGGSLFLLLSILLGVRWQNEVRDLLDLEHIGFSYMLVAVVISVFVFLFIFFASRLVRKLANFAVRKLKSLIPIRLAVALGLIISAALVYFILSGVLVSTFFNIADGLYAARDNTAPDGMVQPMEGLRSGTPDAVISWGVVGYQGRGFIGGGPTKEQIEEFNGTPADEPIRVYAGMQSAETADERADLAVEELKRLNAFDREVLVIATATGTGWLDPKVVDTLEFVHGGDTAIVTQQYSYLPSWISFLVDQERAKEAGVALYDAVIEEYMKLSEDNRPKLIAYGLSLGSFGGQEAYSSANDIRRSVDAALFVGTPSVTNLWDQITESRDEGSPMWQPVINGGQSLRFASTKEDILASPETWNDRTRVLYLQHANDPVVWFNFDLIFNKPDWLEEERGRNVSPQTRWYPIVTFLQITLDQAIAASAPPENGHYYVNTPAYAWGSIMPPNDWSTEKAEKLQDYMDNDFRSDRVQ